MGCEPELRFIIMYINGIFCSCEALVNILIKSKVVMALETYRFLVCVQTIMLIS